MTNQSESSQRLPSETGDGEIDRILSHPASEARRTSVLAKVAQTPFQIAIVVTGGGTGILGHCFARAGASKNFLEGVVPYARDALAEYLGESFDLSCASAAAAERLAATALLRATRFCEHDTRPVGLALTAALPTVPERRGQDRIHLALDTGIDRRTLSVELPKGQHTRANAEAVAEELHLIALSRLIDDSDSAEASIRVLLDAGTQVIEVSR
ncbi:MAG: hypothetical protein ACR2NZ_22975 [Rubripirellula sp.]